MKGLVEGFLGGNKRETLQRSVLTCRFATNIDEVSHMSTKQKPLKKTREGNSDISENKNEKLTSQQWLIVLE